MKPIKIALLGSIPKGDDIKKNFYDWKKDYHKVINRELKNAQILSGDAISDNVGPELVVGHDLSMIKSADIIVVDAREKLGAGTAQEMVISKYFKKPLISVIPKDSHHRRANVKFDGQLLKEWIHPFLFISSDYIVESISDVPSKINCCLKSKKVKDISVFKRAIRKYQESAKEIKNGKIKI